MNPSELYAIARNTMMIKTHSLREQVREGMKKAAEEGKFQYTIRTRNKDMEFALDLIKEDGFEVEYIPMREGFIDPTYTYVIHWKKNELALLRDEIAQLKAENAALRLLPGAPEYFATMEHYESLQKKE